MANESFTFWANMKDIVELYNGNEHLQLLIYDAITEYGLYRTFPENDFPEYAIVAGVIQSLVPSLDKSRGYNQNQSEKGSKGGRARKITTEQIEEAIKSAAIRNAKVPTRAEVVDEIQELLGIKIDPKTISRNVPDERKKEIAISALGQNRDIKNVPGTLGQNEMSSETQGQNEDKINVPNVSEGQNGDKNDVSRDIINVPPYFNF